MANQSQDNWEILIAAIIATKMQKNVLWYSCKISQKKNTNSLTNNKCFRNVLMTSNFIYLFIILIASVPIMCHYINKRFFNIF